MLKRIAAVLVLVLALSLQSCTAATTGGLKSYVDSYDGYEFAYPNGWVPVQVANGPDVVFRDLVQPTENISVVVNPIPEGKQLEDLGTPGEVGYKLAKGMVAAADSEREIELVSAEAKTLGADTYYQLEYEVKLPDQERHNLASVVVRRGQLFTFNVSTTENRWHKVEGLFHQIVDSFSVY